MEITPRTLEKSIALHVDGLSFHYKKRQALDCVSLSIREGEIFGLLGPNGSGKSTVLSLVSGLLPLAIGTIDFNGTRDRRKMLAETSVVAQTPSLDAKLTVWENIALAGMLCGLSREKTTQNGRKLLDIVGLLDRQGDLVSTLSHGMRRRVDIARALLAEPRLLLLDEPTNGLDEHNFRAVWSYLKRHQAQRPAERQLTIVVATHRTDEAETCDRVAVLSQGKLIKVATPTELKRDFSGQLVQIECDNIEAAAQQLKVEYDLDASIEGDSIKLNLDDENLLARVIASISRFGVHGMSVRRPTLADAFVSLTGESLGATHDS